MTIIKTICSKKLKHFQNYLIWRTAKDAELK